MNHTIKERFKTQLLVFPFIIFFMILEFSEVKCFQKEQKWYIWRPFQLSFGILSKGRHLWGGGVKFQGASFGAIKIFRGEFCNGSLTGSGPEITIIIYSSRVFRPNVTYMACCWGSVVTEISVAWVMALKCQKKVRTSSRKKAQLLTKSAGITIYYLSSINETSSLKII